MGLSRLEITQLSKAVGYSWSALGVFRQRRLESIREYVGKYYSNNGARDRVPINLLELAMNIYLQRLVAQTPAVEITTDYRQLKEIATRFEIATNHLVKEINLGDTLQLSVTGAMFSMGTVKVGLNRTKVEVGGYTHDSGQPFADNVSLNNWVHDMTVEREENEQFRGDFYNMTLRDAVEAFKGAHDKLIPRDEQRHQEGESDHEISEGETGQREEFRQTIRVLDLWLPKENLMLQCQVSDDLNDPIDAVLNEIDWEGPERGPYHNLGFAKIENNTMPLSPVMVWRDQHDLANKLYRKLGSQATRQKTLLGVAAGGDADGNRVIEANDGEAIRMDNPKNAQEFKFGGVDPTSLGFLLTVKDVFSYMAGNLDMLGGLGPQSETLGQDKLLSDSASMRIQKMQKETMKHATSITEDLAFYLHEDPYIEIPMVKRVKGFEDIITVPASYGPADREKGDFLEYNYRIRPYSLQHMTPEAKLQGLRTILSEMITPYLPMMEAQGITLDFESLFKKVAKLGNIPELEDILIFANPQQTSQPIGQGPQKAPVTKRTYERRSIPGATDRGKSAIMQQALFGQKPQESEVASLMRPTG